MTEGEFDRLKNEEKEHLRQMRALKNAVKLVERQRSVTSALEEMTSRSKAALEANERLIEEIAYDTALNEARLDVALDASDAPQADPEEEAAAMRARALVEETRRATEAGQQSTSDTGESTSAEPGDRPQPLPEKTLGRLR